MKQEMLHISTTSVRDTMHACTRNSKQSNIDFQQDHLSKKEEIWLNLIFNFSNMIFLHYKL